ncbi:MAG: hypothetical protein LBL73_08800 [Synergistaceae bacterium]|nr:hypothetical protein [Synergistaceae bacterium]
MKIVFIDQDIRANVIDGEAAVAPHMGYFTASTNTDMLKMSVASVPEYINSTSRAK